MSRKREERVREEDWGEGGEVHEPYGLMSENKEKKKELG